MTQWWAYAIPVVSGCPEWQLGRPRMSVLKRSRHEGSKRIEDTRWRLARSPAVDRFNSSPGLCN